MRAEVISDASFSFVSVRARLATFNFFCDFVPLGSSFWLNLQVKLGDYKPVVCPTLSSTHGFGDTNITLVSLSDYYVVNEMPVLTSWMHPRSFLVVRKSEDCISDKKAVSCTGLKKKQAIVI